MSKQNQIKKNSKEKEDAAKDIDPASNQWKDQLNEMQKKDPTIIDSSLPGNIKRSRFANIRQPK